MKFIFKLFLILIFSLSAFAETLTILHINDTHGKDAEDMTIVKTNPPVTNYFGGAARRASYINGVRNSTPNVIVLHAGDTITGSVFSTIYKGMDEVEVMNRIKFDVAVIGNHAFDYGVNNFNKIMKARKFPTISANIKWENGKYYSIPYIIKKVGDLNVAIIGLTTTDAVYNPDSIKNLVFEDEIETLKTLLKETPLNETNNVTILLSHVGYKKDQEIAKAFPNVFNVIVGGHSHTKLEKPTIIGNTYIVQTECYGKYVGKVDLDIVDGKVVSGNTKYVLVPMDEKIPQDPNMLKYVRSMEKKISKEFDVKIASLPFELPNENIRLESTPLGNFSTDLLLESYPEVDIAIINSGALRATLPEGTITLGKIQNEFFPYDNEVVVATFDGKTMKDFISQSGIKRGSGGFLHFSKGINIVYDKNGKLISCSYKGKPILDNDKFVVAINSYLFDGGDGYVDSKGKALGARATNVIITGNDIRDALINNLKAYGDVPESSIDVKPRITFK